MTKAKQRSPHQLRMNEYIPTIPIIRFKPHKVKSKNMMDKMLNRYFDKVVEGEFNQQRMRMNKSAKGVSQNVVIDVERMSTRNIDFYKRVLEAKRKKGAVSEGIFKHNNNQRLANRTKGQTKIIKTLMDNKRCLRDENVHTLEF